MSENGKPLLIASLCEVTFCSMLSSAVRWVTACLGSQATDFSGCFLPQAPHVQPKPSVPHSKPGATVVVRAAAQGFLFCDGFTLLQHCLQPKHVKPQIHLLQPEQQVSVYNQCCFISCTCKLSPVSSTNTDPYQSCHMVGGLRLVGLFSRRIFLVPARFCVVTWLSGPWNEISLKTHRWSQRSLVWDQIPLTSLRSGTPWPYCFSSYIVGERR